MVNPTNGLQPDKQKQHDDPAQLDTHRHRAGKPALHPPVPLDRKQVEKYIPADPDPDDPASP